MGMLRHEFVVLTDEENDRIMRNHFFQTNGDNRERLAEAQGVAESLRQFKEQPRGWPRGGAAREEAHPPDLRRVGQLRQSFRRDGRIVGFYLLAARRW